MKRRSVLLLLMCFSTTAIAGFKVKLVKPKKADQFQVQTTTSSVTYAADLLLEGKAQDDFFYKELAPSNVIAVRLAVFNRSAGEVVLPLEGIQLFAPEGKEIAPVAPDAVAKAVLQGLVVTAEVKENKPVAVSPSIRTGDPRYDPSDPRYDPRMDPTDPSYDPNDPRNRRYGRNGPYGPYIRPGIDVVLNPGASGGGGGDLSQFERQLVEKDFDQKAHAPEPILSSLTRDRFLYFSIPNPGRNPSGFILKIPPSKGIPQEIILKF